MAGKLIESVSPLHRHARLPMATAAHLPISVSEYLHTSYHPDCDYVDGVIEERNLGELDHAEVQRRTPSLVEPGTNANGASATLPEIRVQTSATRFRIADIAIVAVTAPREQIIQTPPVAIIEVLSPRRSRELAMPTVLRTTAAWVSGTHLGHRPRHAQGLRLLYAEAGSRLPASPFPKAQFI